MTGKAGPLRGKAIEVYGSVAAFSDAIGWSRRKGSYVTTGRQSMTTKEVEECAKVLRIDTVEEFMRVFYPRVSIKWSSKEAG
jgi:hypothetical protein